MKIEDNNKSEEFIKEAFDSLEVNPPDKNWAEISELLDADADAQLQQQFEQFEVQPKPQVWENIKGQLPYNLRIRRHLNWLAKVAAILLIGMLISIGTNSWKLQHISQDDSNTSTPSESIFEATPFIEVEANNDFVFDVNKKKEIASELMEEEEINSLLDFILDDSDDIAMAIDEEIIEESLNPADKLPMEGLVLVTPEDDMDEEVANEEADLKITIPLVVVEESEIESFINMYDANVSHGAISDSPE